LFGVVVSKVTKVNEVEELEQEAALQEEGDRPRVKKNGGATQVQCEMFLYCCYSWLHLV
jgi:hypothetical protein